MRFGKKVSMNFACDYVGTRGVSVMTLYVDGKAEASIKALTEWREVVDRDAIVERFHAAGFTGNADWPHKLIDQANPEEWAGLTDVLGWVASAIADADMRERERLARGATT